MGSRPLRRGGDCPGTLREVRFRKGKGERGERQSPAFLRISSKAPGCPVLSDPRTSQGCARGRDAEPWSSGTLPTLPEARLSRGEGVCAGRRAREAAAQREHSSSGPWLFSLRRRWGSLAQKPAIAQGQRQRRSGRLLPWPCGLGCFPGLLGGARRRITAGTQRAAGNSRLPAGECLKRLGAGAGGGARGLRPLLRPPSEQPINRQSLTNELVELPN